MSDDAPTREATGRALLARQLELIKEINAILADFDGSDAQKVAHKAAIDKLTQEAMSIAEQLIRLIDRDHP